jgi:hypothetical protein
MAVACGLFFTSPFRERSPAEGGRVRVYKPARVQSPLTPTLSPDGERERAVPICWL